MQISGADATTLLRKWENDSTEIKAMFEAVPQASAVVKFHGKVEVSVEGTLAVASSGSSVELFLDISDAQFEYQDWREAPDRLKEWSKTHFESLLVVRSRFWRCSFFESKE